jgi:hypothetical protein
MARRSWLLGLVWLAMMGIAGCANPLQKGEAIAKYDKGKTPILLFAPEDGGYALYSELSKDPETTYALKKGEPLGFKTGKTGKIIAVAGKQEIEINDQDLIWRKK